MIRLGLVIVSMKRFDLQVKEPLGESSNNRKEVTETSFCDPLGVRTQDPNIKSVVLYQLS